MHNVRFTMIYKQYILLIIHLDLLIKVLVVLWLRLIYFIIGIIEIIKI